MTNMTESKNILPSPETVGKTVIATRKHDAAPPQSKLLKMPPEILQMILAYVLYEEYTILPKYTEELISRLRDNEAYLSSRDTDTDDNNTDVESEDIVNDDEYEESDSDESDTDSVSSQLSMSSQDELNVAGYQHSLEKGQQHICHWLASTCRHKIRRWSTCYPQVLATCRQLNAVGEHLLSVDKEVDITYHYQDLNASPTLKCYVCDQPSVASALAKYPGLRLVDSWSVTVIIDARHGDLTDFADHLDGCEYDKFKNKLQAIASHIQADISSIKSFENLLIFGLELRVIDDKSDEPARILVAYFEYFSNQFRSIRARDYPIVFYNDGKSFVPDCRDGIEDETMSSLPAYDMLDIKARTIKLVNDIIESFEYASWGNGRFVLIRPGMHQKLAWIFYDVNLPHIQDLGSLKARLSCLEYHWLYWKIDSMLEPMLDVLRQLQNYIRTATERMDQSGARGKGSKRLRAAKRNALKWGWWTARDEQIFARRQQGDLVLDQSRDTISEWKGECDKLLVIHEARRAMKDQRSETCEALGEEERV